MPRALHKRIVAALYKLEADPRHRGVRGLSGFANQWRARVGDYRILYEIDDQRHRVHVYRIAHRGEAYRK